MLLLQESVTEQEAKEENISPPKPPRIIPSPPVCVPEVQDVSHKIKYVTF